MTPAKIGEECLRIETFLRGKGYYMPKVTVYVNWIGYEMTICVETRTDAYASCKNHFVHGTYESGFEELFDKAQSYAESMKSIEDAKRDAFIAAVGKLIDQGREIGVEVDFLNPLTEMMTKLSSNILEKK